MDKLVIDQVSSRFLVEITQNITSSCELSSYVFHFNKQHVENWKDVVNVIEATFGTSLSLLFIQHGGLQRIALATETEDDYEL